MYVEGITLARSLSRQQKEALARAKQRLLNESERRLTVRDVFGDQTEREDLSELVAQWRAIGENQKAEKLAGIALSNPHYA